MGTLFGETKKSKGAVSGFRCWGQSLSKRTGRTLALKRRCEPRLTDPPSLRIKTNESFIWGGGGEKRRVSGSEGGSGHGRASRVSAASSFATHLLLLGPKLVVVVVNLVLIDRHHPELHVERDGHKVSLAVKIIALACEKWGGGGGGYACCERGWLWHALHGRRQKGKHDNKTPAVARTATIHVPAITAPEQRAYLERRVADGNRLVADTAQRGERALQGHACSCERHASRSAPLPAHNIPLEHKTVCRVQLPLPNVFRKRNDGRLTGGNGRVRGEEDGCGRCARLPSRRESTDQGDLGKVAHAHLVVVSRMRLERFGPVAKAGGVQARLGKGGGG